MNGYDLGELDGILASMKEVAFDGPGGETEWLEALSAWCVDTHSDRSDDADLARRLSLIWEVGGHLEKELSGRFQIRATHRAQFPYAGPGVDLMGGVVETYKLKIMSDDPRELACAIAAEVIAHAGAHHNVVMFRRLVTKVIARFTTPQAFEYQTSFGFARV